ncbi:unnamed protein product [Closterium sp. NIES-64]|nr:unnamed protein product [Closterium sp. NIES-64]
MKNFTDNFTRQWSRDTGFTSGMAGTLNLTGEPNEFNMPMYQKTTRYYLFALENCYEMPVPAGHYLIRMFFNPGPPNERGDPTREFAVSTLSTQIAMITPRTPGEFREMMVTYPGPNAELDVCFVANPSALSAFVNALEILPIDPEAYVTDPNYILFNYVRLRTGKGMSFGDGVSLPDKDKGHRQWFNMSTAKLLNEPVTVSCEPTCTYLSVPPATAFKGADVEPHYFPSILYSSAITNAAGGKITFKVTIPDKGSRVLVVLHFAEIDPTVTAAGARVFSIFVNGKPTPNGDNVDLIKWGKASKVALFKTVDWQLGPDESTVEIVLAGAEGASKGPTVAGLEVFRLVSRGPRTNADEFKLMRKIRDALVVPQMSNWQGDPCAPIAAVASPHLTHSNPLSPLLTPPKRPPHSLHPPPSTPVKLMRKIRDALVVPEMSNWQGDPCAPIAWPGVGCRLTEKNDFSITGITLSAAELSGSLLPDIHLLKNLQYLNLSNNHISGGIPQTLINLEQLTMLDLSANDLKGSIPRGFSSMPALKILDLHDNELTGGVPADLFPPPPGVMIDFSNNPDVCGTTTRPACEALGGPGVSDITIVQPTSSSVSSTQIVWIITACILGVLLIIAVVVAIRLIFFQPHLPLEDDDNGNGGFYSNAHRGHFLEDEEPPYVATLDEEAR